MRKTFTVVLAACAAAAVMAPAGASAAKPKTGKFWIEVNGTQVTTWETKRHDTYFDCQGQRWTRGGGTEEINFRTKRIRALITLRNGHVQVKYGNWHPFKQGDYYIRGKGSVERSGERVFGIEPDERCWDGGPTEESGPYDCRPIPVTYDVDLEWHDSKLEAEASPMITTNPRYDKCPLVTPDGILGAQFEVIESEPFPYRDLFSPKFKYHEILGSKDFTYDDGRHTTAHTKVRWTARFRRVK
ncbi:MAG TPA: hypothetical protein VF712_09060 [Thermoleophilaceae bacterium]